MNMKLGRISILLLIVLSLVILSGCFLLPQRAGYVKIMVYSGEPNSPSAVVNAMETLFVGIDGLEAFERYNIKILNSNDTLMAEYTLSATEDGKLPPTAMWPEAGLPPVVNDGPVDPGADIQVGSYKIRLTGPGTDVTFPFSVISRNAPIAWSSDAAGELCNSYQATTEDVYVTGMNFPANQKVTIYIMRDKDSWSIGELLNDSNNYVKKITQVATVDIVTDSEGRLAPISLGAATIYTNSYSQECINFDIIVDANQDGYLDDKDAVDARNAAGYTVQRPPTAALLKFQIASNGKSLDYTTHWNDEFYYPDSFNKDGSGTGFPWAGFGRGVFCILNPFIDNTDVTTHLVYWSQVQVWVITLDDFEDLAINGNDLTGKDVSDYLGRPDLVTVQRTCSNGAGSILIWQAPLVDRRGNPYVTNTGYVVIVEKPNQTTGLFENKYHPATDFVDGALITPDSTDRGFSVVGP